MSTSHLIKRNDELVDASLKIFKKFILDNEIDLNETTLIILKRHKMDDHLIITEDEYLKITGNKIKPTQKSKRQVHYRTEMMKKNEIEMKWVKEQLREKRIKEATTEEFGIRKYATPIIISEDKEKIMPYDCDLNNPQIGLIDHGSFIKKIYRGFNYIDVDKSFTTENTYDVLRDETEFNNDDISNVDDATDIKNLDHESKDDIDSKNNDTQIKKIIKQYNKIEKKINVSDLSIHNQTSITFEPNENKVNKFDQEVQTDLSKLTMKNEIGVQVEIIKGNKSLEEELNNKVKILDGKLKELDEVKSVLGINRIVTTDNRVITMDDETCLKSAKVYDRSLATQRIILKFLNKAKNPLADPFKDVILRSIKEFGFTLSYGFVVYDFYKSHEYNPTILSKLLSDLINLVNIDYKKMTANELL